MDTEEAIETCERWFRHIERQHERTLELQRAANLARKGQHEEAMRIKRQVDASPRVFDGAALQPAVEQLLARLRALSEQNRVYRKALEQLADNELSEDNCASVDLAGQRVRTVARRALQEQKG